MKKIQYIFLLLLGFAVTSCTEVIEVDVPENTVKLVVEGYVTTEMDSSFVRLTKSVGYFDNNTATPYVTNAVTTVNGITFTHVGNGIYKPASPYVGTTGTTYNLKVVVDGKTYTSTSLLEPMFQIDSITTYYKEGDGIVDPGYAVKFYATDTRSQVKYTYFRFGFNSVIDSEGKDSIYDFRVLFDNKDTKLNFEFELPFLRLQPNDTALMVFRSIDLPVYRYFYSLGNRSSGGPFSTPPANLPTNIVGEQEPALGLFAAYDVIRTRTLVK